jgi:hypothetical protein
MGNVWYVVDRRRRHGGPRIVAVELDQVDGETRVLRAADELDGLDLKAAPRFASVPETVRSLGRPDAAPFVAEFPEGRRRLEARVAELLDLPAHLLAGLADVQLDGDNLMPKSGTPWQRVQVKLEKWELDFNAPSLIEPRGCLGAVVKGAFPKWWPPGTVPCHVAEVWAVRAERGGEACLRAIELALDAPTT